MKVCLKSLLLVILFYSCGGNQAPTPKLEDKEPTEATQFLEKRSKDLEPHIVKVRDNVYTAIGYDVSTVTLIETTNHILYVDSGMIPSKVKEMLKEFRKISSKPVHSIFLTHGHIDHASGAKILSEDYEPNIWGMANFGSEGVMDKKAKFQNRFRPAKQAGFLLPQEKRINNGVAPAFYPTPNGKPVPVKAFLSAKKKGGFASDVRPNSFVEGDRKIIKVDDTVIELHHAPGETDDGMIIWLPNEKVLFAGDNFYRSWPNLYAIRGTIYRNVQDWVNSLQKMIDLDPHYLVGGHTLPILGKEEVEEVLSNYKGAIEYVFTQTIEGMNQGMGPDQLVEYVQLPEKYQGLDYLAEYYGRVDWSVRSIHNGYVGWYDGNPSNLDPLSPKVEAQKMGDILGGVSKLENHAKNALNNEEYQWAAELCDRLLALDSENTNYKLMKATAMQGLGMNMSNATGRNYYLSEALILKHGIGK